VTLNFDLLPAQVAPALRNVYANYFFLCVSFFKLQFR